MGFCHTLVEVLIGRDVPWSAIDGRFCKVLRFAPLAQVEEDRVKTPNRSSPYAMLEVSCPRIGEATLLVTHRLDFVHLWQAHRERTIDPEEEVLIAWSSSDRVGIQRLFRSFLPRLNVMVYPSGTYEKFSNPSWWSALSGEEGLYKTLPLQQWRSTDTA